MLFLLDVGIERRGFFFEAFDFFEQGLHHLGFLDVANGHAAFEDDSLAGAGRDAQVGFLGFAEAVDQAAEDADSQWVFQVFHLVFDLGDDALEIDVEPAAGGAGDDFGLGHPSVAGPQDVKTGCDLGHRVAKERNADRIADAAQEHGPDAGSALERSILA